VAAGRPRTLRRATARSSVVAKRSAWFSVREI
jgi:hypothetical protein